ncbi:hypothetical protein HMPREF9374_2137 [Desmospora sp. 8437]|nr:hypothetical protein HMPREF9374_2137 [Desmospora sp. 8437]
MYRVDSIPLSPDQFPVPTFLTYHLKGPEHPCRAPELVTTVYAGKIGWVFAPNISGLGRDRSIQFFVECETFESNRRRVGFHME